MNLSLLKLHLAQAGRSLQKAKNNNYSDREKQRYQEGLSALYQQIVETVNQQIAASDDFCFEQKRILDFIYKSLEFLDSSTLNLIPYETVECLKSALSDWIHPSEQYIIVTSLINGIYDFSFDPTLVEVDGQYKEFKQKYNVEFTSRLVQINIPKALSRDYLASVVHYHELAHFIDTKYAITDSLSWQVINRWQNRLTTGDTAIAKLDIYFPFLNKNYSLNDQQYIMKFHLGEYFCDLFASQYIGDSLNSYLLYITENNASYSPTHPSSINRGNVVADFLAQQHNVIVELIAEALQQIVQKELKIRFEKVSADDFYNFLPPIIGSEAQLHGLLAVGWDVWNSDWNLFKERMHMNQIPEAVRIYTVINNLIEKSIGNYTVQKRWTSISTQAR